MNRYEALVRILDGIREEARPTKFSALYALNTTDLDKIWQARSRAYVHLYLKVMFGIRDFQTREAYLTDGSHDGGIDGYYIDQESRSLIVIQSKFRINAKNYESKSISADEISAMQIRRILSGENLDIDGVEYNGKIKGFQRKLDDIPDLGRYSKKVIIIANVERLNSESLTRLADGFPVEVFDHEHAYKILLFPALSGTLYKANGLSISLDVSNKTQGARISYEVEVGGYECEITVVFVPTIEIARIMNEYRNSVLTYNPRGYLEFEGETVNSAIRASIVDSRMNDFAILNNGITIVCDETSFSDSSGKKNRAKLFLTNPQIINGGQTAYTLSRVFEEIKDPDARELLFAGKEVLLKAIALTKMSDKRSSETDRIKLIERISTATNSQTVVTRADRNSNDPLLSRIQQKLFEDYGILLERKRGEFAEGLRAGYIDTSSVVGRAEFFRVYFASNKRLSRGLQKRQSIEAIAATGPLADAKVERYVCGKAAFAQLTNGKKMKTHKGYTDYLPKVTFALLFRDLASGDTSWEIGRSAALLSLEFWESFLRTADENGAKYVRSMVDRATGIIHLKLSEGRANYQQFEEDAKVFVDEIARPALTCRTSPPVC